MKSTVVFWLIVATAFVLRAIPAFTAVEDYLEKEEFIPAAMSISWHHLPIREYQHPAMPAYLIKLSSLLFGTSLTGYRFLNVLCGVGSVVLIYAWPRTGGESGPPGSPPSCSPSMRTTSPYPPWPSTWGTTSSSTCWPCTVSLDSCCWRGGLAVPGWDRHRIGVSLQRNHESAGSGVFTLLASRHYRAWLRRTPT